jgi:hypothetical protein
MVLGRLYQWLVSFLEGSIMNRWLWIVGLALVVASLSGCIVINTERTESCRVQPIESESMMIREIDAVGKLSLESNREDGYRRIAQRHGLSTGAQVHLVKAVFEHLSLEDSKMNVLLALVHNPSFRSEAKVALLDRLDQLSLEDDRREILAAMSKEKD